MNCFLVVSILDSRKAIIEKVIWSNYFPPATVCNRFTRPILSISVCLMPKLLIFYFSGCSPVPIFPCIGALLMILTPSVKEVYQKMYFYPEISSQAGFLRCDSVV